MGWAVHYDSLFRLDGRVALVTGAGAGIGRATAEAFHQGGAHVVVTDVDAAAAATVASSLGAAAEAHRLDVADEDEVRRVVAAVVERHERIDVLVNNAGLSARTPTTELETARWQKVLDVGPTGSFLCAREVGRHMVAAGGGAIVNVASIMGLVGGAHYANLAYHAAKGALVNMTRALAVEWGPHGVRVNAVAPTFARTQFTAGLLADEEMAARLLADTPMGRFVEPYEVAAGIRFLASDAASMVSGQILAIDGGWVAR